MKDEVIGIGIVVSLIVIVFITLSVALGSWAIVQPGHTGVLVRLGAVEDRPKEEGFHLKVPLLHSIEQMNTKLVTIKKKADASSKDLQNVTAQVTIQYSVTPTQAPKVFQKIGSNKYIEHIVLAPSIEESVKSVTAQYTAEQLITKRKETKDKIAKATQDFIEVTLREKKLGGALRIANVAITDFAFSPEFDKAIELKVTAEQNALKAKNEKIERITKAEAANEEKKLQAEAEAYQIEIASKAKADAIKREAAALKANPELIQLRIAEKWDGTLPKFSGSQAVPLLNLGEVK